MYNFTNYFKISHVKYIRTIFDTHLFRLFDRHISKKLSFAFAPHNNAAIFKILNQSGSIAWIAIFSPASATGEAAKRLDRAADHVDHRVVSDPAPARPTHWAARTLATLCTCVVHRTAFAVSRSLLRARACVRANKSVLIICVVPGRTVRQRRRRRRRRRFHFDCAALGLH